MENYLLCGELSVSEAARDDEKGSSGEWSKGGVTLYKGRKRGTVEFFGVWRHHKSKRELVANGVRIMHSLNHTNVLKFYEWYETPKHIWVITELASGGTLAEIIEQDGHISPNMAMAYIKDIASGLNFLHRNGILYCDLCPKKIVLDTCQCLKLSDFTLAQPFEDHSQSPIGQNFRSDARSWFRIKQLEETRNQPEFTKRKKKESSREDNVTMTDYLPSPFYAAPELFKGSGHQVATDLWSLGCVVFEMLTGRQPFSETSLEDLERAVCSDTTVGGAGGALEKELGMWSNIVHGLLKKSPEQRFRWKDIKL